MQYTFTSLIAMALSCNFAHSIPFVVRHINPGAINNAQGNWEANTSLVSSFLSTAESLTGTTLANAAQAALNAENDELNQKAVLDSQFVFVNDPNPTVQVANAVLVDQGAFAFVVQGLQGLADDGATMTPDQVSAKVQSINQDRCNRVLPAIDQYFIAAASFLNNGEQLSAVRPTNCP